MNKKLFYVNPKFARKLLLNFKLFDAVCGFVTCMLIAVWSTFMMIFFLVVNDINYAVVVLLIAFASVSGAMHWFLRMQNAKRDLDGGRITRNRRK